MAFLSSASNLVSGDTTFASDVFVHDRQTGAITRVSVDSSGVQGNNGSSDVSISADGRFVAFTSNASNLVSGDINDYSDVFVHDRQTGATTRVSVDSSGAQGAFFFASISANGRFVAFNYYFLKGTTYDYDVFVHDRQTGATTRVSVDSSNNDNSGAYSANPSISADGRFVAFTSDAYNLVPGDTNGYRDVFVHDRLAATGGEHTISGHMWENRDDNPDNYLPLAGVTLALDTGATTVSGADGAYEFTGLAPGSYRVSASKQGYHISPGGFWTVDVPPSRDDIDFIGWSVPIINPIANADGDGNYTVSWVPPFGAESYYELLASRDGASYRLVHNGSSTKFDVSVGVWGEWCYTVKVFLPERGPMLSETECTRVNEPESRVFDVLISLYRTVEPADVDAYQQIIYNFADFVYEMSNGVHKIGNVTFAQDGIRKWEADIIWEEEIDRAHASLNGYGKWFPFYISFGDVSQRGDHLSEPVEAGWILAHEWGHYFYGLCDEYKEYGATGEGYCSPLESDDPVVDSIMGGDLFWVAERQGEFSAKVNNTRNTAQHRAYGASGWETLVRHSMFDPPRARLIAGTGRTYFPELVNVAPAANERPSRQLPELRAEARNRVTFTWEQYGSFELLNYSDDSTENPYQASVGSSGGPRFVYPDPVLIEASVGEFALVGGADLVVTIARPDGSFRALELKDDGIAPDMLPDDGLYTGLMPYDQDGEYEVSVDFSNKSGNAFFTVKSFLDSNPAYHAPYPVAQDMQAEAFTIVTISGYKNDDHGDFPELATFLAPDNTRYAGRIDRAGDLDVFRFDLPATGALMLRVSELALDMQPRIRVFEADGLTVLGEYEMAPDAETYFLVELVGDPGEPIFVEIHDKDVGASGGLYKISAGEALPNEVDDPGDLDGLIYLPIVVD